MYEVAIVEDSQEAADLLLTYVDEYAAQRGISLHCQVYKTAFLLVSEQPKFDLILMDIAMPIMTGLEAAEYVRTFDQFTPIIFVTDLAQYAVKGYAVDALDFIVKPVAYADFVQAMDKAMRVLSRKPQESIKLSTKEGLVMFPKSDLIYVEMLKHNLQYHIVGEDKPISLRGSMKQLEQDLDSTSFFRISSGCIINFDHVVGARAGSITLSDGTVVFPSRAKKRETFETLARYMGGSL